jgi:hypothetical protein
MLIRGEWLLCDDGEFRPVVTGNVQAADGSLHSERFLIDSGADSTVLGVALLNKLGLTASPPPPGITVSGVGGSQGCVVVSTMLELLRDDGGQATVRGKFLAFQTPGAVELSILGNDVLYHFDLILARQHGEVLLLAPSHHYHIEST